MNGELGVVVGLLGGVGDNLSGLRYSVTSALLIYTGRFRSGEWVKKEELMKFERILEAIEKSLVVILGYLDKRQDISSRDPDVRCLRNFYQGILDLRNPGGVSITDLVWMQRRLGVGEIERSIFYKSIQIIIAMLLGAIKE